MNGQRQENGRMDDEPVVVTLPVSDVDREAHP
jgi:hypothetical protein